MSFGVIAIHFIELLYGRYAKGEPLLVSFGRAINDRPYTG